MTTLLDRLNLRPQERRLVVMAAAVLFLVLQFWLVWPHFQEWGQTKTARENARRKLLTYRTMLAQTNELRLKLDKLELEGQGAGLLAPEQVGRQLVDRIGAQARDSKVSYSRLNVLPRGSGSRTNEFFEEQTVDFGVNPTGDKELIGFLVAIGNSDLMVRVKDLSLNPAPGGYQLQGSMKLVASFQKKNPAGPAAVKSGARADALSSTRP